MTVRSVRTLAHIPLLTALLSCIALSAATPDIDQTMNYGIGGLDYNSTTHRIVWWSGQGRCGGEVPSPATLSMNTPFTLNWRRDDVGMACSGSIEGFASDESYFYFSQGGWLWRLPIQSTVTNAPTQLNLGVSVGYTPAAMARLGDDLYWIESNGTFSKLWKASGAGTGQQQLLLTGNWGPVHKLRVFYATAAIFSLSCCFLSDNGQLWKAPLDPASGPTLMTTGVVDFDLRSEGGGGLLTSFVRVFAAQSSQLLAIHFGNGSSSVLYPSSPPLPAGHSLGAVAVDDNRVYLIEKFSVTCAPFTCPAYNVMRQDRPLTDFTPRPWITFGLAQDGLVQNPRNFYSTGPLWSYGTTLIWGDGRTVRSISADAPPIQLNFRALGLEVVQAIQNLNNEVPLVMGKHTFVRAYAAADFNTTGLPTFFPNATLTVSGRMLPFQPFQQLGTLNPVQMGMVDTNVDLLTLRLDANRSYLFELPAGWTTFTQLQCDFTVNSNHGFFENYGSNPYGDNTTSGTASFVSVGEQCWVFVAVNTVPDTYYPQVERYHPGFWNIINRGMSMLPVDRIRVETWPDVIGPIFSTGNAKFDLKTGGDWANARGALACWTIGRSRPCSCTRYIGTVHPNAGLSSPSSGIGGTRPYFANSSVIRMEAGCPAAFDCPRGGEVLAHELGHNFGRSHVNCGKNVADIDGNYPYPLCTMTIPDLESPVAHFGFDTLGLNVINPGANGDLMSYAGTTWPSDYTWRAILFSGDFNSGDFCFPIANAAQMQPMSLAMAPASLTSPVDSTLLILSGTVDQGSDHVNLFPGFIVPTGIFNDSIASSTGAGGTDSGYHYRLADGQGSTLDEQPLALQESDGGTTIHAFAQSIPFPLSAQLVQILHNGQVRAERYLTPHAPVVSLSAPNVNAATQTLECDWTASDADGDELNFTVQYSSDNGNSWIPLQVGSPNTSLRVDVRELAGGSQSLIRVIASDGLRTAIATSAPFVVPNSVPAAVIIGVQEGDRIPFGSLTSLTGIGHDLEDGMLDPARFLWIVSGPAIRGGRGERFALNGLPPGPYTATLRMTDSGGQSASNSVHFEILPLSVPDRPAPVIDGLCADAAYVNALQVGFLAGTQQSVARMSHADGFLHVAFTDLPFSSNPNAPLSVGIAIDTTGSRPAAPNASDVAFYVDETGLPSQWQGNGTSLVLNPQPALGVQTAIVRSGNAWSAELKIPESLIGGWGHTAGLLIHVRDENGATSFTWPTGSTTSNPASWAAALFGLPASTSNRPPVAVVQAPRVLTLTSAQIIKLDGRQSYDPDGQAVTYHWTQLSGPTVIFQNPNAPVAAFNFSPSNTPTPLRFRLVVNDGSADSTPADSDLVIYSVALNPQPFPPIWTDTSSGGIHPSLIWPGTIGDRAVIEASQDLKVWVPIRTNSVDFDGLLHFSDPDSKLYPWRFYRAHGLSSSDTVVYSQDFEHAVGPEWSPAHAVATTPVGARHFLGQFGAEVVNLSLAALPAHTRLKVSCDLFIIGPWDGNFPEGGPDEWQLQIQGGATLLDATFSTTFSNQSYPGVLGNSFPPRTNAAENDTLGYSVPGFGGGDSVYHLSFTFDHIDSSLVLGFNGLGLQTFGDETWGIDNVVIETINNP